MCSAIIWFIATITLVVIMSWVILQLCVWGMDIYDFVMEFHQKRRRRPEAAGEEDVR